MAAKYHINLLQPELLPKTPLFTLVRVLWTWAVVLIVMLTLVAYSSWQQQRLAGEHQRLARHKQQQSTLQSDLERQLQQRRTDTALAEQLQTLKTLLQYKQALTGKLTDKSSVYVAGFADAMTELAQHHHREISLQHVLLNDKGMTFSGEAKYPDAVPQWLAGFENSILLSGMSFGHFKLTENQQKLTDFEVSSHLTRREP